MKSLLRDLLPDLDKVELTQATEIHRHPCKHCPSAHHPASEEMEDILAWDSRPHQLDTVFRCAWRTTKACRGYCDALDVSEEELKQHVASR